MSATATASEPSAWSFAVTCAHCGGHLVHDTSSKPTDLGTRVTAIAHCAKCRRRWQLIARIIPFTTTTPEEG